MIITVTLNPSLDRTGPDRRAAPPRRGLRPASHPARLDPGGKGVNVGRALLANGVPTQAVLPVAGIEGDQLVALLQHEGPTSRSSRCAAERARTSPSPRPTARGQAFRAALSVGPELLKPNAEELGPHRGASHREASAEALAWGAAVVRRSGTKMPGPADIDHSVVHILADPVPA